MLILPMCLSWTRRKSYSTQKPSRSPASQDKPKLHWIWDEKQRNRDYVPREIWLKYHIFHHNGTGGGRRNRFSEVALFLFWVSTFILQPLIYFATSSQGEKNHKSNNFCCKTWFTKLQMHIQHTLLCKMIGLISLLLF